MFNLEQSIMEWRKQMLTAGIKTPVPLEELESHLREEIERQMRSGTDAATAFAVAVERIGRADDLKTQFETTVEIVSALERKVTGILLVAALGLYTAFGLLFFVVAKVSLAERTTVLAAVVFTVLTGLSGRSFFYRYLPIIARKRHRIAAQAALLIVVSVWLVVFFNLVLPHFDFALDGQFAIGGNLVAAILWGMSPIGVLNAFIVGLDEAAWQKSMTADS